MTDDQFRTLMDAVLKLSMQVEEMRLRLERMERMADTRHRLVADWVGPQESERPGEVEMPDDVRKLLKL